MIRVILTAALIGAALSAQAAPAPTPNINDYRQISELKHFAREGRVSGAIYLNDSVVPPQIHLFQGSSFYPADQAADWFCQRGNRFRWSQPWVVQVYLGNGPRVPAATCIIGE